MTAPGSFLAVDDPIRIGVSSCLLGNPVRFDGGHKRDPFLVDLFGRYVEWVPVCPEVEAGMTIPRPTLRLQRGADGEIRLICPHDGNDHTDAMRRYAQRRVRELERHALCGYVLKKDSPSCGMERVKVYPGAGMPARSGSGLFAMELIAHFPHLPIEEEGRLNDPVLRESFIERVFAYRRLRSFFAGRWTLGQMVAFHTAHKLQLMAHSVAAYGELGRLVATARGRDRVELQMGYEQGFMEALARHATRKRHTNVLQHMAGYFKRDLDDGSRRELATVIDEYRQGLIPLIVPLTLLRHYVRRFEVTYLRDQIYLQPHPKELMLRNHV